MSYVALFDRPTTSWLTLGGESFGLSFEQNGGSLYHSTSNIQEAAKSYWFISNSVPSYSTTSVTRSGFNLLDRQTALQLIHAMESLEDNWDGFGGASILKETATIAASFVSSLPAHVPAPEVSANPNGTISLEWENDLGRAHLELGNTKYSLYFRRSEGMSLYRDGFVNEIDHSKEKLVNEMYSLASPQDYTISNIRLAQAA